VSNNKDMKNLIDLTDDVLPSGWIQLKIGDVLKIRNGFAFKSKDYTEKGILLVRQTNLGGQRVSLDKAKYLPETYLKDYSNFQIKKDDILIGMSGSIGKLCIYDRQEPALQNQRTGLLEFYDESIRLWLWYYLPTLESWLLRKSKGVAVQNISASQIEAFPIPVAPKNEQKRIVAEIEKQISRLDDAVENLKRVKPNLKRYKASVLKAAVEGKLTEEWREKHPKIESADKLLKRILAERCKKWEESELTKMKAKRKVPKDDKWRKKYKQPSKPDLNKLPLLPSSWEWASVEQLAEIQLGKMLDRQKHFKGNRLAYLRNINVRWGAINTDDLLEMFFKDTELNRYGLEAGDVLVCEGGEPGRAAVWDGSSPDMKYQKALHRVRFYRDYEEQFLVYYLEFLSQTGRLKRCFTGSTIKHFTKESFSGLPVPVPPKDEQVEIVSVTKEHLSNILVLERNVDTNLIRADRLRQSILKKAFSGKLFPQINTDKSAENMLQRSA
jgi:type I restriction enzyme, S subunit